MRVIEIYEATGKTKTEQEKESRKNELKYDFKIFAIDMDRKVLYNRINKRVDIMFEQGIIDETQSLLKKHGRIKNFVDTIGYKEVLQYLDPYFDPDTQKKSILLYAEKSFN